jgi:hypothetical protein
MPIPSFKAPSVKKALEQLLPQLAEIKASTHDSTKYDLLWRGHRFPPKVVVRKAVEIEHGIDLPESDFSGGTHAGQANGAVKREFRKDRILIHGSAPQKIVMPSHLLFLLHALPHLFDG